MIQRRQRVLRKILSEKLPEGAGRTSLLEIGCGSGQWLAEFQIFGFDESKLAGIELEEKRFQRASQRLGAADIKHGDAAKLPWPDGAFDIVFQSTVFTSVLSSEKKKAIADEMRRVCSPRGFILWYDFAFNNPSNPNVKGVGKTEIESLFTPWQCSFTRVTLAPPIARRLVPLCWTAAEAAETICPFLRTHIFALISPPAVKNN
jgi:ubiquinone/menaquinone biosynthesis C-methylase UbiE